MTLRTFVALPLEPEAVAQIDARLEPLRGGRSDVRWVRPESLHLTLAFLGWTEEALVPRIAAVLRPIAAGTAPCNLLVDGAGAFPTATRPRVLWLGLGQGSDWFVRLALAVRQALGGMDLAFEREEREAAAHLTLARLSRPDREIVGRLGEAFRDAAIRSRADRLVLYASRLGTGGVRYEPLETLPLSGGA